MHSRSPEDNASAMQYAPHPDSLSARQEAGYPASQGEVSQEALSFSVHHLSLSHLCPIQDQVIQVHAQPLLPSHQSYRNHAVSVHPGSYQVLPSTHSFLPHLLFQAYHRFHSFSAPSEGVDQMRISEPDGSSFLSQELHADPDNLHAHSLTTQPSLHPVTFSL